MQKNANKTDRESEGDERSDHWKEISTGAHYFILAFISLMAV